MVICSLSRVKVADKKKKVKYECVKYAKFAARYYAFNYYRFYFLNLNVIFNRFRQQAIMNHDKISSAPVTEYVNCEGYTAALGDAIDEYRLKTIQHINNVQ